MLNITDSHTFGFVGGQCLGSGPLQIPYKYSVVGLESFKSVLSSMAAAACLVQNSGQQEDGMTNSVYVWNREIS